MVSKFTRCGLAAATALAMTTIAARAADLEPYYKAPMPMAPSFTWTGWYIGGFVGGAEERSVITPDPVARLGSVLAPGTPFNCNVASGVNGPCAATYGLSNSIIGGVTNGWNWQAPNSRVVFGVESEWGYIRLKGTGTFPFSGGAACNVGGAAVCDTFASTSMGDWFSTYTGRFGVTDFFGMGSDHVLLYGKLGAAVTRIRTSVTDTCGNVAAGCSPNTLAASGARTIVGVAAGAGIEWALSSNWSVKGEWEYLAFDNSVQACGAAGGGFTGTSFCSTTGVHGVHTGKFGINYRLPGSGPFWPFGNNGWW